jgi:predicted glycosyltransferase
VVVPYEKEGETEQRLRAEILAAKGLITLVPAAELTSARLAVAVTAAAKSPHAPVTVNLSGAANTARLILGLAGRRRAVG